MATRARRKAVRAVEKVAKPAVPVVSKSFMRTINTPAFRTTAVLIGTAGLAALAVAIVGPKRIERDVIKPLRGAIEPQAEKLWADSRGLREQFANLFRSATPTGREKLVRSFQSWIGHFHAT